MKSSIHGICPSNLRALCHCHLPRQQIHGHLHQLSFTLAPTCPLHSHALICLHSPALPAQILTTRAQ